MPAAATVPRAAVKRAPLRPLQTLPPLPSDPPAHPAQLTPVELICECGHSHRSESERKNATQRRTHGRHHTRRVRRKTTENNVLNKNKHILTTSEHLKNVKRFCA